MRTLSAIAGSAVFFIVAPGMVAGLVPWLLTDRYRLPLLTVPSVLVGSILIVAAAALLLHCFARFALEGMGTPAPVAPTERLVVGGIYRHVRNPMYVAVLSIILGQALLFSSGALIAYAAIAAAAMVLLRQAIRGTDARPPLRRRIRDLPPHSARLAASPEAMARRTMISNRPIFAAPTFGSKDHGQTEGVHADLSNGSGL